MQGQITFACFRNMRQKHVSALSPTPCDSSAHGKGLIYRGGNLRLLCYCKWSSQCGCIALVPDLLQFKEDKTTFNYGLHINDPICMNYMGLPGMFGLSHAALSPTELIMGNPGLSLQRKDIGYQWLNLGEIYSLPHKGYR